jgi:hypothetical protein
LTPAATAAPTSTPTSTPAPPTSTATVTPTSTATVAPTPTVTLVPDTFWTLLQPFIDETRQKRQSRERSEPDYQKKIDKALNEGRINWLMFCYGETHEPPQTEKAIIGSHTIVSLDYLGKKIQLLSITHDTRAPEIERVLHPSKKGPAMRMDRAFFVGGFELNRQVVENATGLVIDYQFVCRDSAIKRLVDEVLAGIEVEVKTGFAVQPFYLDGEKFPAGTFPTGWQRLNGTQVVQFIKTVPATVEYYGKDLEHNARKAVIFQGIMSETKKRVDSKEFWGKMSWFLAKEAVSGAITYENPLSLFGNGLEAGKKMVESGKKINEIPGIDKSLYVVDPSCGDGGVRWANDDPNPITQQDITQGVYLDRGKSTEVPVDANPYGDLPTEYWSSVRKLVREFLAH